MELRVLHKRLGRGRLLKLLRVDRRRGRILGRGGRGVGHGGLTEGPVVEEVRLGREPLYVSMFGSGFRSVTGQFPEPAVFAPPSRKGNCIHCSCTGADPGQGVRECAHLPVPVRHLSPKLKQLIIHGLKS